MMTMRRARGARERTCWSPSRSRCRFFKNVTHFDCSNARGSRAQFRRKKSSRWPTPYDPFRRSWRKSSALSLPPSPWRKARCCRACSRTASRRWQLRVRVTCDGCYVTCDTCCQLDPSTWSMPTPPRANLLQSPKSQRNGAAAGAARYTWRGWLRCSAGSSSRRRSCCCRCSCGSIPGTVRGKCGGGE